MLCYVMNIWQNALYKYSCEITFKKGSSTEQPRKTRLLNLQQLQQESSSLNFWTWRSKECSIVKEVTHLSWHLELKCGTVLWLCCHWPITDKDVNLIMYLYCTQMLQKKKCNRRKPWVVFFPQHWRKKRTKKYWTPFKSCTICTHSVISNEV